MRSCPETDCDIVGQMSFRDSADAVGEYQDWYEIEWDDDDFETAWVYAPLTSDTRPAASSGGSGSGGSGATSPPSGAVCDCSANIYNCPDFGGNQSAAQACYNYCVSLGEGDIHRLDGNDGDGIVCE